MIEVFKEKHQEMLKRVSFELKNLEVELVEANQVFEEIVNFMETVLPSLSFVVRLEYISPAVVNAKVKGGRIILHTRTPRTPRHSIDNEGLVCIHLSTYGGAGVTTINRPYYCQLDGDVFKTEKLPEKLVAMESKYLLGITDPTRW